MAVFHDGLEGTNRTGGIGQRLAGGDVELPGVPRASHDLSGTLPGNRIGLVRDRGSGDLSLAQRAARMRAEIGKCEELPVDIENADRSAVDLDDPGLSGFEIARGANLEQLF